MTAGRHTGTRHAQPILWAWLGFWLVMFVATHLPVEQRRPLPVPSGDKIFHFAGYFVLTWLGGRYWMGRARTHHVGLVVAWGAVYLAYAALDEWLQQFTGRTMSRADWLADAAGVVAATAIVGLWAVRVRKTRAEAGDDVGPTAGR